MAEIWPAQLQDYVNEESFSQSGRPITLKSQNESGPSKRRRRFTKAIFDLSCTITIDRDDYQVFEDFFYTTLGAGVKAFAFDDPITGVPSEFKIEEGWNLSPIGGRAFRITMNWEKQP